MAAWLRNLGIEVAGWALLGLAVIVLPLPIVPSLLLIAALAILSSRYIWAERLLDKVRKSVPLFTRQRKTMESSQSV
ncbi:MAG: hypothetical protein DMG65_06785 [Candidatus Angelobacter sp. Gp1-AA117]|nr:MAG: hypothetical protein DMG65_06785 [Candidatus Angelobacter sp. Gp1-AA117]